MLLLDTRASPLVGDQIQALASELMILTLPFELRAIIWNHVFIIQQPTVQLRLSPHAARNTSVLRVLTVCKTIHREALHIFYRHNRLLLTTPAALFLFLSSLHGSRRMEITALTVAGFGLHYTGYQCAAQAFSMLQLCPNLTQFQLKISPEHSWDILEVGPWRPADTWRKYQSALDCLGNLRGLSWGSIVGIDPKYARDFPDVACTFYEEVTGPRAAELKTAWLRPRGSRDSSCNSTPLQRKVRTAKAILPRRPEIYRVESHYTDCRSGKLIQSVYQRKVRSEARAREEV